MTYAAPGLVAVQDYMHQQTGLPTKELGIVGDTAHGTSGYHVGWDRLKLGKGEDDYSYRESPRDHVKSDAATAFDLGNWYRRHEFTKWLVDQCIAGSHDTLDIREVIYSLDDINVHRWDRLKIRTTGDSSHTKHTHISFFRDSATRSQLPLFERFFMENDDMAKIDDVHYTTTQIPDGNGGFIPLHVWCQRQTSQMNEQAAALKDALAKVATLTSSVVALTTILNEIKAIDDGISHNLEVLESPSPASAHDIATEIISQLSHS